MCGVSEIKTCNNKKSNNGNTMACRDVELQGRNGNSDFFSNVLLL